MFTTYFYVNSGAYMQSNWVVTASRVESLEHLFGMAWTGAYILLTLDVFGHLPRIKSISGRLEWGK